MAALVDEMHSAIVALAGPRASHDSRESMIARAATAAGISYRQAKAFFYREAANPSARAVARVQAAMNKASGQSASAAAVELERIAQLEAENAVLRQFIATALAGMASATPAEKEQAAFGYGATASRRYGPQGVSYRSVAQAPGASR